MGRRALAVGRGMCSTIWCRDAPFHGMNMRVLTSLGLEPEIKKGVGVFAGNLQNFYKIFL
jgi:hypothetical protein